MPKPGYKQSPEHKRKRAKKLEGKRNPAYKDGRRSYRRVAGAEEGDGSVVHHRSGDRKHHQASNLERLTDGDKIPGRRTTPKHEAITKRAAKSDAYWVAFAAAFQIG
jgi:hypothetical protein